MPVVCQWPCAKWYSLTWSKLWPSIESSSFCIQLMCSVYRSYIKDLYTDLSYILNPVELTVKLCEVVSLDMSRLNTASNIPNKLIWNGCHGIHSNDFSSTHSCPHHQWDVDRGALWVSLPLQWQLVPRVPPRRPIIWTILVFHNLRLWCWQKDGILSKTWQVFFFLL